MTNSDMMTLAHMAEGGEFIIYARDRQTFDGYREAGLVTECDDGCFEITKHGRKVIEGWREFQVTL